MEPDRHEQRLWECASGLDVVQEAERVASWQVGVEHLFTAALLDPVTRRLFVQADGDLAEAWRQVGRPVRAAPRNESASLPHTPQMAFTDTARRLLDRLLERVDSDPELARRCEVDRWRGPQDRSTLRRWLLHELLTTRHELADAERPLPGLPPTGAVPRLVGQLLQTSPREPDVGA